MRTCAFRNNYIKILIDIMHYVVVLGFSKYITFTSFIRVLLKALFFGEMWSSRFSPLCSYIKTPQIKKVKVQTNKVASMKKK